MSQFVSRAGRKLDHALTEFRIDVGGLSCADLGSNVGGFVECLLRRGAARVYAIDTGYGLLDWKLRKDPRVVVMERTNAMYVELPEPVDFVSIDVSWTRQRHILPAAQRLLRKSGTVVSLIKPHYEAPPELLRRGLLPAEYLDQVMARVKKDIESTGFSIVKWMDSPIRGSAGNREYLVQLRPRE